MPITITRMQPNRNLVLESAYYYLDGVWAAIIEPTTSSFKVNGLISDIGKNAWVSWWQRDLPGPHQVCRSLPNGDLRNLTLQFDLTIPAGISDISTDMWAFSDSPNLTVELEMPSENRYVRLMNYATALTSWTPATVDLVFSTTGLAYNDIVRLFIQQDVYETLVGTATTVAGVIDQLIATIPATYITAARIGADTLRLTTIRKGREANLYRGQVIVDGKRALSNILFSGNYRVGDAVQVDVTLADGITHAIESVTFASGDTLATFIAKFETQFNANVNKNHPVNGFAVSVDATHLYFSAHSAGVIGNSISRTCPVTPDGAILGVTPTSFSPGNTVISFTGKPRKNDVVYTTTRISSNLVTSPNGWNSGLGTVTITGGPKPGDYVDAQIRFPLSDLSFGDGTSVGGTDPVISPPSPGTPAVAICSIYGTPLKDDQITFYGATWTAGAGDDATVAAAYLAANCSIPGWTVTDSGSDLIVTSNTVGVANNGITFTGTVTNFQRPFLLESYTVSASVTLSTIAFVIASALDSAFSNDLDTGVDVSAAGGVISFSPRLYAGSGIDSGATYVPSADVNLNTTTTVSNFNTSLAALLTQVASDVSAYSDWYTMTALYVGPNMVGITPNNPDQAISIWSSLSASIPTPTPATANFAGGSATPSVLVDGAANKIFQFSGGITPTWRITLPTNSIPTDKNGNAIDWSRVKRWALIFNQEQRDVDPTVAFPDWGAEIQFEITFANWSLTGSGQTLQKRLWPYVQFELEHANVKTGSWSFNVEPADFSGRAYVSSGNTGDTITTVYDFGLANHSVYLSHMRAHLDGYLEVYLDGILVNTINLWNQWTTGGQYWRDMTKLCDVVAPGRHEVVLRVKGQPGWAGGGTFCNLDALFVGIETTDFEEGFPANPKVGMCTDYNTTYTRAVSAAHNLWMIQQTGLTAQLNEYISIGQWSQHKWVGAICEECEIALTGSVFPGETAFIDFGGGAIVGVNIRLGQTLADIAQLLCWRVNQSFSAVCARLKTGSPTTIIVSTRSPNYQFPVSTQNYHPGGGPTSLTMTQTGNLLGFVTPAGIYYTGGTAIFTVQKAVPGARYMLILDAPYFGSLNIECYYDALVGNTTADIAQALVNQVNIMGAGYGVYSYTATRIGNTVNIVGPVDRSLFYRIGLIEIDTTRTPRINTPAKKWHDESLALVAAAGIDHVIAFSPELYHCPVEMSQKFANGIAALTGTPSYHTHFGPSTLAYFKEAYKEAAAIQAAAGLVPQLQFGEVQWWYGPFGAINWYSNQGSMPYYDAATSAAALVGLGRPLHLFITNNDDPSVNAYADANFLRDNLGSWCKAVFDYVRATYPTTRFEPLYPLDANRNLPYEDLEVANLAQLRVNAGPYTGAYRVAPSGRLDWYFTNLALIRMLPRMVQSDVLTYMNLYLSLCSSDRSIILNIEFDLVTQLRPDSHDAYAGTFLILAVAYSAIYGNNWFMSNLPALKNIAYRNIVTQIKGNNLVGVFQTGPFNSLTGVGVSTVGYTMDACEAYRGLRDFANLLTAISDVDAAYYTSFANTLATGVHGMFDETYQTWRSNDTQPNGGPSYVGTTWYADLVAPLWPQLWNVRRIVETGTPDLTRFNVAWTRMETYAPNWPTTTYDAGGFPWASVGYLAYLRGVSDNTVITSYMHYATYRYTPYATINELGWMSGIVQAIPAAGARRLNYYVNLPNEWRKTDPNCCLTLWKNEAFAFQGGAYGQPRMDAIDATIQTAAVMGWSPAENRHLSGTFDAAFSFERSVIAALDAACPITVLWALDGYCLNTFGVQLQNKPKSVIT